MIFIGGGGGGSLGSEVGDGVKEEKVLFFSHLALEVLEMFSQNSESYSMAPTLWMTVSSLPCVSILLLYCEVAYPLSSFRSYKNDLPQRSLLNKIK